MIWADIKQYNEFNSGYYRADGMPLLRYSVAKHAKKLLLGKGVDITTESKEFKEEFMKWSEDVNFIGTLEKAEEVCSLYGVAYLMYNLNEEDKNIFLVDPHMPVFPSYTRGKLSAIDFYVKYENPAFGTGYVHEQYHLAEGKLHIKRTAYKIAPEGASQVNWTVMESSGYTKEEIETHNVDFIPVFPVFNQNKYLRSPLMGRLLSDWYNASFLECDYLNALEQRTIERMINKSYIIGSSTNPSGMNTVCPHTGINASGWLNEKIRGKEGETSVEIVSVASKLGDLRDDLDHIKESFFDECGYSFQNTQDQAGSDTATGQMLMKGKDIETTVNKRNIRTRVYNDMLQTVFERDDFQFIINENISIDENQMMDIFTKARDLGIMTRGEMRAKAMGITIEQAEEDLVAIDAEEQERIEALGLNEEDGEDNGDSAE